MLAVRAAGDDQLGRRVPARARAGWSPRPRGLSSPATATRRCFAPFTARLPSGAGANTPVSTPHGTTWIAVFGTASLASSPSSSVELASTASTRRPIAASSGSGQPIPTRPRPAVAAWSQAPRRSARPACRSPGRRLARPARSSRRRRARCRAASPASDRRGRRRTQACAWQVDRRLAAGLGGWPYVISTETPPLRMPVRRWSWLSHLVYRVTR